MATATPPLGRPSSRLSPCLSWQPGAADGVDTVPDTGAAATDLVRLLRLIQLSSLLPSRHAQEIVALSELKSVWWNRNYRATRNLVG